MSTRFERQITTVWSTALGEDVDPDSNFFDLGGNSAKAVAVQEEVSELFDFHVPLRLIYDNPRLEMYLRALHGLSATSPGPDVGVTGSGLTSDDNECMGSAMHRPTSGAARQ